MTVTAEALIETKYAEDVLTTQYTSAAGTKTLLDKFTATATAAGGSLLVYLVPSGGTADAAELVASKTLAASESYTFPEVVGHTLMPGDFLATDAGAASTVVIRASGRKVT